jgi:hypothetical protein
MIYYLFYVMTDSKDDCPVASTRIAIIIVGVIALIVALYFVVRDMTQAQRIKI